MRYVLMGFSAWPLATSLAKALAENTCRYTVERPPLLHRQLMSVFVSAGLISAPGTPCTVAQSETLCCQRFTHTHTPFSGVVDWPLIRRQTVLTVQTRTEH